MYKTKISCLYIQFMYQAVSAITLNIIKYIFRISYDPKRYPRYIPEAYCLCKGCLIGPYGEESSQYRSTLVYAPSVILRRTGSCVGGRHSYTEIYVSIAVGCTCVPLLEKRPKKSNQSLQRREPKARKLFTPRKEAWRKQHCCCREVFFCLFFYSWFARARTLCLKRKPLEMSLKKKSLVQSFSRQIDRRKTNLWVRTWVQN